MRFLFVINTFYPETVAASAIVMNLADYLIKRDYQVDVLSLRKDETINEFEIFNDINIHRIIDYNLLNRKYVKNTLIGECSISLKLKITSSYLINKLSSFIQLKYTGDNIVAKRSRLYEKKLEQLITLENYESIITVNGDLSGAVAATKLKIKKKEFRFILYQVDPYTSNYVYDNKNKHIRHQIEKEIFKYSDNIIMPPSNYLDVSLNKFHNYKSKIKIIEFPKILKLIFKPNKDDVLLDKKFINVVYTGMLYKDIRNPKYMLEMFSKLDLKNVKIYFVGCTIPEDSIGTVIAMEDRITILDRISQQSVSNLLLSADILVNIGNSVLNTFPSKLFEYFSAGKPIINFHKSVNCPTLMYTIKYPEILNVLEDYALVEENIIRLKKFINCDHKAIEFSAVKEIFSECTVSEVGKEFEKILINENNV